VSGRHHALVSPAAGAYGMLTLGTHLLVGRKAFDIAECPNCSTNLAVCPHCYTPQMYDFYQYSTRTECSVCNTKFFIRV
jgi:hypothetical protein